MTVSKQETKKAFHNFLYFIHEDINKFPFLYREQHWTLLQFSIFSIQKILR